MKHRLARLAAVDHLRRRQVDIASRLQDQPAVVALHIHARHAVDGGARKVVVAAAALNAARGADGVDIPSGAGQQRVGALDHAADVVDIGTGGEIDAGALDGARQVSDVVGAQLHHFASGQRAAVEQAAAQVQVEVAARNQRAAAVDIAWLNARVNLRHQHRLGGTIRQPDLRVHQPDDIFGQQRHLLRRQRHAERQVVFLTEVDGVVHQRLVLLFVVAVAVQIALTRQVNRLFTDQTLLVVAVAQAFQDVVAVLRQPLLHIVAAQPLLLLGKARIGLHQIFAAGRRIGFEQAVVRQARIRPDDAHHTRRFALLRRDAAGDFKTLPRLQGGDGDSGQRARRGEHAVRRKRAARHGGADAAGMADCRVGTLRALRRQRDWRAANVAVIDQLARLQRNRLNHLRRRIG